MKRCNRAFLAMFILVVVICLNGCAQAKNDPQTDVEIDTQPVEETKESDDIPEMVLTFSALSKEGTGKSQDARIFIDIVKEKSEGRIQFEEYFNATLGAVTVNLDTIGTGIADIGQVCNIYTPSALPLSQISYCMPFAPVEPAMVAEIMTRISEKQPVLYEEYEKQNVHVLAYKGNEPYKVYSNMKIDSLEGLNGLKVLMGGIYYIPWFESQGAVPVGSTAPEFYQTIKTNVAPAGFVYDSLYTELKLYEVAKYVYDVGMGTRNNDQICINLDLWNSLNKETQSLLEECAREALDEFHVWESNMMKEWEKEMADNGCEFAVMSDEEKAIWAKEALAYKDTIKQWIDDVTALGYDGATLMSDYLQIAEDLGWVWSFDSSAYKR